MSRESTIRSGTVHQDDIKVFNAETLIHYLKASHLVYMAAVFTGNVVSKIHIDPEIEAIRAVEAQRGADRLGAKLIMMCHKDSVVWLEKPTWKEYASLTHCANPDVIITLCRDNFVHDHSNVSEPVNRVAIWASVANISSTKFSPIDFIPTIFHPEPAERPV